MPFAIVLGIPTGTPEEVLAKLRTDLVATLVEEMEVSQSWVRPIFPKEWLGNPSTPEEGTTTIVCLLVTAMFNGKRDGPKRAKRILDALVEAIWEAFEGAYEVEAFVMHKPQWKSLKAASE